MIRPGNALDVGAAVSANFGFVAHPAQRDARELSPERVGDAFSQRSFPDSGRTDQTKDRSFELLLQFDDGQKLEQPIFHLLQSKMLFVQNPRGGIKIELIFGRFVPGKIDDPIEVVAR